MKAKCLVSLVLVSTFLSAQDFDISSELNVGYALSYSDLSRLEEVTNLDLELSEFQFGALIDFTVAIERWEFNASIRTMLSVQGEAQLLGRAQARIGLGYRIPFSETWMLRLQSGIVEESGEFQAQAPQFITPGPVPLGNFNHYSLDQYYIYFQPVMRWTFKMSKPKFLPHWLEIRPNLAIPTGTGTFRWKAGDGQNLITESLWGNQWMLDLSFGWRF